MYQYANRTMHQNGLQCCPMQPPVWSYQLIASLVSYRDLSRSFDRRFNSAIQQDLVDLGFSDHGLLFPLIEGEGLQPVESTGSPTRVPGGKVPTQA